MTNACPGRPSAVGRCRPSPMRWVDWAPSIRPPVGSCPTQLKISQDVRDSTQKTQYNSRWIEFSRASRGKISPRCTSPGSQTLRPRLTTVLQRSWTIPRPHESPVGADLAGIQIFTVPSVRKYSLAFCVANFYEPLLPQWIKRV